MHYIQSGAAAAADADRGRMTEVIHNLLQNAIKFTTAGCQISVSAKSEGGNIVVRMSDQGPSINSEIMPKLFRKFATKSDIGNGFGLHLCKVIVEAHDGKIYGENNRDAGATFWFSMPARM